MNKYTTADFDLVTYLVCLGFIYTEMGQIGPRKAEFIFPDSPELQIKVDEFWKGKGLVEPKLFSQARKTIKAHFQDYMQNEFYI